MLHSCFPSCALLTLSPLVSLIRLSSLGAESRIRAASDGALFQPPLLEQPCLATAWWGRGSGAAAHHLTPPKSLLVFLAAQQQVALAVSSTMRIDVTHQALVPELIQTALGFCEMRRGELLNCLIPQGHWSTLKGQEH